MVLDFFGFSLEVPFKEIPFSGKGRSPKILTKSSLKIGCDLIDVYVYLDGKKVGKTPLKKRLPVSSGWHRIRIDVPGATKFNQSGIPTPDFRDVYVTKGRTQKVTFKFLNETEEPG